MASLEEKSRPELLEEARGLGIDRPERMTRVELRDAIIQRTVPADKREEARGLFGVARSMLASVVETGLHLPDAAKVIRGDNSYGVPIVNQTPVATVTLAEIYATQGHKSRALKVLEDVLTEEPEHEEARRVWIELSGGAPLPVGVDALSSPRSPSASAPLSAPSTGETPDYVPGGFVETTGEAVESEEPPEVREKEGSGDVSVAISPPLAPPAPNVPLQSSAGIDPELSSNTDPPKAEVSPALVLVSEPGRVFLYWELPRRALEECGVDVNEGAAHLRLVALVPRGAIPERFERSIPLSDGHEVASEDVVHRGAGWLSVDDLPPGATVRAAVGWEFEDAFLPLAVARSIEQLGADRDAVALVSRAEAVLP